MTEDNLNDSPPPVLSVDGGGQQLRGSAEAAQVAVKQSRRQRLLLIGAGVCGLLGALAVVFAVLIGAGVVSLPDNGVSGGASLSSGDVRSELRGQYSNGSAGIESGESEG